MALTAYTRFRFLWGALDVDNDDEGPTYGVSDTQDAIGGQETGRRCILRWTRTGLAEDVLQTHIDLVNITTGQLDDTWTGGDYGACETAISAFWTTYKAYVPDELTLAEYRWYRIGPGATPPEPAVRVTPVGVAATNAGTNLPHQISCAVTWKTALRKRWGRSYLPGPTPTQLAAATGHFTTAWVDVVAGAIDTMVDALAASDFYVVVYSPTRQRLYTVESVQVDDIPDVIRRRRSRANIYRKQYS